MVWMRSGGVGGRYLTQYFDLSRTRTGMPNRKRDNELRSTAQTLLQLARVICPGRATTTINARSPRTNITHPGVAFHIFKRNSFHVRITTHLDP